MRRALVTTIGCVAVLALAGLVVADVVGSKHDLSSDGASVAFRATNVDRVCAFCHTPHMAAAALGQYPLWNHTLSARATYGLYDSDTLDATDLADIGDTNTIGTAAVSNLCMSCHDGTIGMGSLYNEPNQASPDNSATLLTGNANMGIDLSDDHPVNFTYNTALATADGELANPAAVPAVAALLIENQVQCSSCHDPHDTTFVPFLTEDNTDSGLCTTCHIK